jgi:intracellular septation protein
MDGEELAHAFSYDRATYSGHDMQLLEFFPILVFVIAYYFADIFVATAALIAAVAAQIGITVLRKRPVSQQLKVTFWLTLAFGGLTLAFQDKTFIQWKPTIVNWLLAAALIGSQYVAGGNLLERMLGRQLPLPSAVWRRLNLGWAIGFFLAGALNLFVAYNFSEQFWVNYKLIGGFALTLLYVVVTIAYLTWAGHLRDDDDKSEPSRGSPP